MKAFKVLLILGVATLSSAFDYCELCKNHIACNNTGSIAESCPNTTVVMNLSGPIKENVVQEFNLLRNLLAGGKVKGYKSASKMMRVTWDEELANLAELNSKKCEVEHDSCRATSRYSAPGQNVYSSETFPTYKDIESVFSDALSKWFEEHKLANQTIINECCGGKKLKKIGNFLQLAKDRVEAIGCGMVRYKSGKWFTTIVTCNYSLGNILNEEVYSVGKPGSACPNGTSSAYPNLCD